MLENTMFDGLTFDLVNFVKSPKCIGRFFGPDGSGCLITAFMKAFGFSVVGDHFVQPVSKGIFSIGEVRQTLDKLGKDFITEETKNHYADLYMEKFAHTYDPQIHDTETIITNVKNTISFSQTIIFLYDNGKEVEAISTIWELIDKLPNKKGMAKATEIVLPIACPVR